MWVERHLFFLFTFCLLFLLEYLMRFLFVYFLSSRVVYWRDNQHECVESREIEKDRQAGRQTDKHTDQLAD